MASSLPRATRTARGSLPCWITPSTMAPPRPAYPPKVSSSSASRSRCSTPCRSVSAAIRLKPSGVSSYSRVTVPSAPVSAAQTVTWPLRLLTSTRAVGAAPSVRWYATRSASSMALMARSIEMSFSASRLFRTLRSISIGPLLVRAVVGVAIQRGELDLYPSRAQVGIAELTAGSVDVDPHPAGIRAGDTPGDGRIGGRRRGPGLRPERRAHHTADRAPPVLGLGQRAVDARRGNLKGVGRLPHRSRPIERGRQLPARERHVVKAYPAVGVDHDAQPTPPSCRAEPDIFPVPAQGGNRRLKQADDPLGICGASRRHPRRRPRRTVTRV